MSPEALEDCRTALNELIDGWNIERLAVHTIARRVYDLAAGQTVYVLGDLEGNRPARIEAAGYIRSGVPEQPVELLTRERWASGKHGVYHDNDFPVASLHVQPAPAAGDQLVLYPWQALQAFENLETSYAFPQGYALALRFNLAAQLGPSFAYGAKISQVHIGSIEAKAAEYKGRIKSINTPVHDLSVDSALLYGGRGGFDILTGF
jgi:hypothetical protein